MKQWFCSKEHQIEYYKLNNADKSNEKCYESIYEESELIVEDEPPEVSMTEDELNKVVQSSMFIGDQEDDDKLDTWDQKNLNQISGIGDRGVTDTTTIEFYTRIGRANGDVRGQCLRYCRWPSPEPTLTQHVETNDCNDGDDDFHESVIPLWLSSLHQPQTKDIPHCECCGSERRYEFQIMPQMLHFLFKDKNKKEGEKIDSTLKDTMLAAASIIEKATEEGLELEIPHEIQNAHDELKGKIRKNLIDYSSPLCLDWGVISVYTCVQSCDGRNRRSDDYVAYTPEFAWRQPPLSYDENSN
jgi:pre-rRNA-processing protein TSR4